MAAIVIPVVVLVTPWTVFVSSQQHTLVPLSTYQGYNLFLGAGLDYDRGYSHAPISVRYAEANGLRDTTPPPDSSLATGVRDAMFRQRAVARWTSRPFNTAMFGLLKICHAFGFSIRGEFRDLVLSVLFILSLFSSFVVWKLSSHLRSFCLLYWSIMAVVAIQAFVFLANQRFCVTLFDFPAVLMIALGLDAWWNGVRRQGTT